MSPSLSPRDDARRFATLNLMSVALAIAAAALTIDHPT